MKKYCSKIEPVRYEIPKKYIIPTIINVLTFYMGCIALYLAIWGMKG